MAKSEQAKQRNAHALILANQTFPKYKEYIAKELFFSEFGVSYKTFQEFQYSWRDIVAYSKKCEEFLKFKSKIFLHMMPIDNELYSHPRFLRILTRQICNYISRYIAHRDNFSDRVTIADELYKELHTENSFIQHKRDVFCAEHCHTQRQTEQQEKRKRARIHSTNAKPVRMSKNEERKLGTQSVNARLKEKRKELGIEPRTFTAEEESQFKRLKAEYKQRKEQNLLTVQISIEINEK